jgi:hypothetical protein
MQSPIRLLAALGLAFCAVAALAAPTLEEDPYGSNKPLVDFLRKQPQFDWMPQAKPVLCGVSYKDETLALYEHTPLGKGIVGTQVADFTKFDNDKLVGEPYRQSGTFGGIILLRGTASPSTSLEFSGAQMFPLVDGKSFKITLQRSRSKLEYACNVDPAPKRFDLNMGQLYLVSCERHTILPDGERRKEAPNFALCSDRAGLCPLHWTGHDGHKQLFEYYEVNKERFSPVSWQCEMGR